MSGDSFLQHAVEHRRTLRALILARAPSHDDAPELARVAFERAALACGPAREAMQPSSLGDALAACAEGAAAGAAAVLGFTLEAAGDDTAIELAWPGGDTRLFPAGRSAFGASDWLRAVACACIARDAAALAIACRPTHVEMVQGPAHLYDPFWPPLCRAVAAAGRGEPPRPEDLALAESLLAEGHITCGDVATIRAQVAPLVLMVRALGEEHGFEGALRAAVAAHHAYFADPQLAHDPFRFLPLEACGLAALAHDRGVAFDAADLPRALVTGERLRPPVTVTLVYALRHAERPEDPTGFLDLRGFPRAGREHVVLRRGPHLVAAYTAGSAPRVRVEFQLPDDGRGEQPPRALDAGERLLLAQRYAEASGAANHGGDPLMAREWLAQARAAVDAVLESIAEGADAVAESQLTSAAGREVYAEEPGRFTRARLEAYREGLGREQAREAREAARAGAAWIEAVVKPMLESLARDRDGAGVEALRPQPGDYERVFAPEAVAVARDGFEALWNEGLVLERGRADAVIVHAAPAGMLAQDNELSRHFPGAYRSIARWLDPRRVWVAWKYAPPGGKSGVAYDGLVWVDDHWAWFPKPWRVLTRIPSAGSRSS